MMNERNEVEILLVEDNPHDAEMAMRALRKNNLSNRIVHVGDGAQALDYLFGRGDFAGRGAQAGPRIVLLDLKLPKVDGLEVLKEIKGNPGTLMTPVVVLTSSLEERDMIESYRLGVNSYIVKPVDFDAFSAAVAELGYYWLLVNQPPK